MTNDQSPVMKRAGRFLGRLDVASVLIVVVLVSVALGSFFPQISTTVAADAERLALWKAAVQTRYGALADYLAAAGAFRWFRSPIVLAALALLGVATLVCTLQRWKGVWRRAFDQRVRCPEAALDRAHYTPPSPISGGGDLPTLVVECLGQRGFHVRSEAIEGEVHLRGDRNGLTPAATLVTHLAVLLLLLGAGLSGAFGWREEITLAPGGADEVGHGSGLALRNEGFAIERYPDGRVARYEAQVAILAEDRELARGGVRVNEPLVFGSVGFHLRGYGGTEGSYSVNLLVVHDPGYGPVIAAGLLLLLGTTASFNLPHCWVRARIEPDGTLRLAGWADRQGYDFGREFAALARDVRRAVQPGGEGAG